MMFIIANKNPYKAVNYLISHTNKRFYFKQLIELGQLICSAGFSSEYKSINRGKALQQWIKQNPFWTYLYYANLLHKCKAYFKSKEALNRAINIKNGLLIKGCLLRFKLNPKISTAVFRYVKDYSKNTVYLTNMELVIDTACLEYIKYIESYKFKEYSNEH